MRRADVYPESTIAQDANPRAGHATSDRDADVRARRSCPTHGEHFSHTRAGGHCTKCSWRPVVSPRAASVPPPAQFPAPVGASAEPAVAVQTPPPRDIEGEVSAERRILARRIIRQIQDRGELARGMVS